MNRIRNAFATEEQIWWELDKKCELAAVNQEYEKSKAIEHCMKVLKRPTPQECRKWFELGY